MDARGNRTQAVETILQPDDTIDVQTIEYEYDALSRLLEANYNGGAAVYTYGYDLAGNLTNMEGQTRTYNAANQLTSGGATYDDKGNMTSDGVNGYTWDRANRLLSMGGISYAYDGLGNRVSQTANSVVTQYLLDVQPSLSVVLTETTPSGVMRYVHGPQGVHAHQDHSGNWAWYVQDGLGSVRGEVAIDWPDSDVNGTKMYQPYGAPFGEEGSLASPYEFTGEQTDQNDLVYLRARYLNPSLGIFANADPWEGSFRLPMTQNGYSWVVGNPINDAVGELPAVPMAMSLNQYMYATGNVANLADPTGMFGERPKQHVTCAEPFQQDTPVDPCSDLPMNTGEPGPSPYWLCVNSLVMPYIIHSIDIEDSYLKLLAVAVVRESGEPQQWEPIAHVFLNRLVDEKYDWSCGPAASRNISCILAQPTGSAGWTTDMAGFVQGGIVKDWFNLSPDEAEAVWNYFQSDPVSTITPTNMNEALTIIRYIVQFYGTSRYTGLYYFGHTEQIQPATLQRQHVECYLKWVNNLSETDLIDLENGIRLTKYWLDLRDNIVYVRDVGNNLVLANAIYPINVWYGGNLSACSTP